MVAFAAEEHRPELDVTDPAKLQGFLQWMGDRVDIVVAIARRLEDKDREASAEAQREEGRDKGRAEIINLQVKSFGIALLVFQVIQAAIGLYYFVLK